MPRDTAQIHASILELDPKHWNALGAGDNPFTRHEFLAALERNHCVGGRTGWQPRYLTLHDAAGLAAAAATFVKSHSYGEFVFDFAWAKAYERIGRHYYPKLTLAAPFTPATGPRLLVRPDLPRAALAARLLARLEEHAEGHGLSSVHALFFDEPAREAFEQSGWLLRRDCQFHWSNQGYPGFEHTWGPSRPRSARRRGASGAGCRKPACTLRPAMGRSREALLDRCTGFHRGTFLRHGHEPYLSRASSAKSPRTSGESLMFKIAMQRGDRSWPRRCSSGAGGALRPLLGRAPSTTACTSRPATTRASSSALSAALRRFEPGTQGEHKVAGASRRR